MTWGSMQCWLMDRSRESRQSPTSLICQDHCRRRGHYGPYFPLREQRWLALVHCHSYIIIFLCWLLNPDWLSPFREKKKGDFILGKNTWKWNFSGSPEAYPVCFKMILCLWGMVDFQISALSLKYLMSFAEPQLFWWWFLFWRVFVWLVFFGLLVCFFVFWR